MEEHTGISLGMIAVPVFVGTVSAFGFFVKKWIGGVELRAKEDRAQAIADRAEIKEDVKEIRLCLSSLVKELNGRVTREDCEKRGEEKWYRIYHHTHDDKGYVVVK